jgi:SAM-dependent methyltransferase
MLQAFPASRSCAPPAARRAPHGRRTAVRATAEALDLAPALVAGGAAAGALTVSLVARFAASARLDYALAARLKSATPRDATAALVLPSDARATRDLFLLPDRVSDATAVGTDVDQEWWNKAGVQAGVRVSTRSSADAVPTSSIDVAVIRDAVAMAVDPVATLNAVARTLKPGGVLLISQRLAGGSPLRPLILRSSATRDCMPQESLEAALDASTGWARVALDVVGAPADAAAMVVAVRSGAGVPERGAAAGAGRSGGKADVEAVRAAAARRGGKSKGFK